MESSNSNAREKAKVDEKQKSAKVPKKFSGRQIFSSLILFSILGLLAGYFVYGHIEGEYINVGEFFKARGPVSGFLAEYLLLIDARRNNILMFGAFGLILGIIYSIAMVAAKSRSARIFISISSLLIIAGGVFFAYQSVSTTTKYNPVSGIKQGTDKLASKGKRIIGDLLRYRNSGTDQNSMVKSTMGEMKSIGTAIETYVTDMAYAPQASSMEGLAGLLEPFYIKKCPRIDAWGNYFTYRFDADSYWLQCDSGPRRIIYSNGMFTEN